MPESFPQTNRSPLDLFVSRVDNLVGLFPTTRGTVDLAFNSEQYLKAENISPYSRLGKGILLNAFSFDDANRVRQEIERGDGLAREVDASSWWEQMITDPLLLAEVTATIASGGWYAAVSTGGRAVVRSTVKGRALNMAGFAAASDLAFQGTGNALYAMNELKLGSDSGHVASEVLFNQIISTSVAAIAGGGLSLVGSLYRSGVAVGASIRYVNETTRVMEDLMRQSEAAAAARAAPVSVPVAEAAAARAVAIDKELKRTGDEWDVLHRQQKEIEA